MILRALLAAAAALLATGVQAAQPAAPAAADYRARLPQDEIIYFLLPDRFDNADPRNDRGGLKGDRLHTGFDPSAKGFYEGGDLKGLIRRLDYIKGMGVTAIWVGPIFQNKPVQGGPGQESAGYHGYWITDFTRVDPHLGTNQDFAELVAAAHARGMKVYMDIIANHTADVIQFKECQGKQECPYRSVADFPYQRRGGPSGAAINSGFAGTEDGSAANFARLTDPNYAYTVEVPAAEKNVKVPAWLNDPIYYHNRGNSTFTGESSRLGDFVGLDDLMTEHPRVVAGFIDIYGAWIDRYDIDGFRIDTARHVNPEFWRQFVPAMIARAKARGIPNFHIFGEVADDRGEPGRLARYTRDDKLPAVLDFAFGVTAVKTLSGAAGTEAWRDFFAEDILYDGGPVSAQQLPTFIGNHDAGRFAMFIKRALPQASDAELLKRVMLGHVLMLTARGVPTIYYGDEQGFVGKGGDQDSRQPLFASKVATYNEDKLLGSNRSTAQENFLPDHPLYRLIAQLSAIRTSEPALRRGVTVVRATEDKPGLLAFSRVAGNDEVLVLVNTANQPITRNVALDTATRGFTKLAGECPAAVQAPGSARITLPALGFAICHANR
ncbi:alpha-amylase family glycosyl hydrolase [Sphingomonas sp. KRR8]|uniref:alpha-amylase family glycosyl hydrolase n=1 Tax=Sphingomonas sp. KRR8 TaxID=2942996 RepID=UPI0020221689|nr:alpha-amylase family glycosyl hydrolase [Sphingomonas sp. KRR8]URD60940.1 alpha-amylase family glycosyl hydrolase [Sphingomonas sp. KRR8]URD60948.1 alpha-amylase family glycosyl hydrolase [Sphingomonas sp. KRR8]